MTTTLHRRLGLRDATVIGLGSMLGAGVFVVWGPAASRAGSGPRLLFALLIAALVATANAISSARLAARYPESGGAYVYGYERLGPWWGRLAGWAFVLGKSASCAAMALAIGAYAWPAQQRLIAAIAVVALTAVNLRGITKTALATRVLVSVTLVILAITLVAGATAPAAGANAVSAHADVLGAAGLIFFAFAGYARIATLGEEVLDPARTIPRAIGTAFAIVLAVYVAIALTGLRVLGIGGLATATAPLAEIVRVAGLPGLVPVIRAGATIAVVGVLLALIAGVGRTALAMARRGDAPRVLAAVHRGTPIRAEITVAAVVLVLVAFGGLGSAISLSSCAVLIYYAVANAAAMTLPGRWTRLVAVFGLVACVTLAATVVRF